MFEKAFRIDVNIPTDPKNVLKAFIKEINILFKVPLPIKTNLPNPPPPPTQAVIDSIPTPTADYASNAVSNK
jgi:hypothetical protein